MPRRAFTLVELLVVIAIIGLLSTIAVIALTSSGISARNTKRKADLKQIFKALELYYDANGGYPNTGGSGNFWGVCSGPGSHADSGANGWIPNLAPTYMASLPRDPRTGQTATSVGGCTNAWACYTYVGSLTDYKVFANCTPEVTVAADDPFFDPARNIAGNSGNSYAIYTPNARLW